MYPQIYFTSTPWSMQAAELALPCLFCIELGKFIDFFLDLESYTPSVHCALNSAAADVEAVKCCKKKALHL